MTLMLPEGFHLEAFRPVAYFDKYMDCIHVHTHDRSVTEHRINEFYTVHVPNHPNGFDPQYVGFTIKGVRALFEHIGLAVDRVYRLSEVIDRLVRHAPGSIMSETAKLVFDKYQSVGDLQIDIDQPERRAA